ncbi:MAG: hypothetical protein V1831_02050 [Candidatus Woesearchaeota archaeon]
MKKWLIKALIFSLLLFLFEFFVMGGELIILVIVALIFGFGASFLTDFISSKVIRSSPVKEMMAITTNKTFLIIAAILIVIIFFLALIQLIRY